MLLPRVMFGQGFSSFRPLMEKKSERQTLKTKTLWQNEKIKQDLARSKGALCAMP